MANRKLGHQLELHILHSKEERNSKDELILKDEPNSLMFNYDKHGNLIEILSLSKSGEPLLSKDKDLNSPLFSFDPASGKYYGLMYKAKARELYRREYKTSEGKSEKNEINLLDLSESSSEEENVLEKYNSKTKQWVKQQAEKEIESIIPLLKAEDKFNEKSEQLKQHIVANKYYTRLNFLKNARSPLSWFGDVIGYEGFSKEELAKRKEADIEYLTENFGYAGFESSLKKRKKFDKDFQEEDSQYFNSLAKSINEKVSSFKQGRPDGKFTAYDIETLHILAEAIKRRDTEYQELLQRKELLMELAEYGEEEARKTKKFKTNEINLEGIELQERKKDDDKRKKDNDKEENSSKFNFHDIDFANKDIKNELEVVNKILEQHKAEYEELQHSKKKVADWLKKISAPNYEGIRGQVFETSGIFNQVTKVRSATEANDPTPNLSSFIAQHGCALDMLYIAKVYKKFSSSAQSEDQSCELQQKDIDALLKDPNATLDLANSKGIYAGTVSGTGWSYDLTKMGANPKLPGDWIQQALISAYLNNDKGEIYLSGGWMGPLDKQLVTTTLEIAIAAFGPDQVFSDATSIPVWERIEIEKNFKNSNNQLPASQQQIVDNIQKTLGLERDKDKIIRSGKKLGLNRTEAIQVFNSVKEEAHSEEKTKKDFRISGN